ncbi:acyltransferase domain protein [Moniliophthora roreri MCA 2997]|uniref:Acyltransferase domain protein n=1 Tax=Moniliophthora roreri (strain MCA 2997) TaxID=1381753 RepID=V2XUW7_MONRO|nr:acyltransferase domain protein [Moniliophthora roreri MCA 2997]
MPQVSPTPTPWSYLFIRLLFKFVLKIFYGTIVVENTHLIPENGIPCIVSANHSNSLTDALLLVTSVPSKKRNMLRLTAKSTQFGKKTFTSWLIESAGTVPIQRRKDHGDQAVDNSEVMLHLMEALETGDAVCLFPEGMSRYHPTIAPFKTGVARLVSDVLSRNRDDPDFKISILTCSITYMHRQHFRSDVLVTFHEPMVFTPKDNPELLAPVDFNIIRSITAQMHQQICHGTLDSPSWDLIRTSKLAARIYAPLGTRMSLGDHVRVVRTFLDAFKTANTAADEQKLDPENIKKLRDDLKAYQDQLARLGIKDDRIRRRPLPRRTIFYRMGIRLIWALCLLSLSMPGLLLSLPVYTTTFYAVHNFKKTGPIFDTWDEIAQYKLIYGLISGIIVWLLGVLLTLPFAMITSILIPALMWMSLRWVEDAVSSVRSFMALARLLRVGKPALKEMYERRQDLHGRVLDLAISIDLPADPEAYFVEAGGREKGRARGLWESKAKYFSIRRRRKRDWNETLRLYDKVDYPEDDL